MTFWFFRCILSAYIHAAFYLYYLCSVLISDICVCMWMDEETIHPWPVNWLGHDPLYTHTQRPWQIVNTIATSAASAVALLQPAEFYLWYLCNVFMSDIFVGGWMRRQYMPWPTNWLGHDPIHTLTLRPWQKPCCLRRPRACLSPLFDHL